jgi:ribosomal protein S18 acetylase RimI-like enzyme
MNLELAKVIKVKEKDVDEIVEFVNFFFPYTNLDKEKILAKLKNSNFFLLKHHQKNIVTSFAELEFFPEIGEARLNAIFVEEAWRGQRIATKLLHKCIHEAKRKKKIHRIFLLVKKSNKPAKELYKKNGFKFEKIHEKIIEGEEVEVWARKTH